MTQFSVGDRITFIHQLPFSNVELDVSGWTGTVTVVNEQFIHVRLDKVHAWLVDWDNEVIHSVDFAEPEETVQDVAASYMRKI